MRYYQNQNYIQKLFHRHEHSKCNIRDVLIKLINNVVKFAIMLMKFQFYDITNQAKCELK